MTGRLVYEIRLRKTKGTKPSMRWRWDISYLLTTDPTYPGVETGRQHLGTDWGYCRFKWRAARQIINRELNNPYRNRYDEL